MSGAPVCYTVTMATSSSSPTASSTPTHLGANVLSTIWEHWAANDADALRTQATTPPVGLIVNVTFRLNDHMALKSRETNAWLALLLVEHADTMTGPHAHEALEWAENQLDLAALRGPDVRRMAGADRRAGHAGTLDKSAQPLRARRRP